ncbi:MAG: 23S rRNA (adenine(2503)-C(2))-methyltransferase RlmN [Bacteroidales bacterium]|nr:23S rRNA (adenine(2503)-C(2))-methyltransferase RlmN [Bacteroidota bacterium]NLN99571.1 23S rRNA (adenine(2503)-C(2))-methyltransferase RlmN [Bacteroidales bacterium]
MRLKLLGMTPEELKEVALKVDLPAFAGKQIARWMYGSKVRSIDEMTNLSKAGRERLKESYDLGLSLPSDCQVSRDGTKKYLFSVRCARNRPEEPEESAIEAVMIPEEERKTLCVSSQAGCRMGCLFCMTGRQGFHGNLSVADILSQFLAIDESADLSNAVFMGMGEPLDNFEQVRRAIKVLTADWGFGWSPKRITLSTIGVLPNLRRCLDETRCHLAVSLHNPFSAERKEMMPVEKSWPLEEVVSMIREYDFTGQRRVSFEYTMFSGINDTKRHADATIRLLSGLECRVNLIRFHKIPDVPFETSPDVTMENFRDRLTRHGIFCTIRASRGEDILAACGMLADRRRNRGPEATTYLE